MISLCNGVSWWTITGQFPFLSTWFVAQTKNNGPLQLNDIWDKMETLIGDKVGRNETIDILKVSGLENMLHMEELPISVL